MVNQNQFGRQKQLRLPRRIKIGGYVIEIVLASQKEIREAIDDTDPKSKFDGVWLSKLGDTTEDIFGDEVECEADGIIYIYSRLPSQQKWEAFWHEMIHALVDISSYDKEHPLIT